MKRHGRAGIFRHWCPRLCQSFENAPRVLRSRVITGGALFTKDVVYRFGLLQTGNAVRASFPGGRSDGPRLSISACA
jgi:hypothetical protein